MRAILACLVVGVLVGGAQAQVVKRDSGERARNGKAVGLVYEWRVITGEKDQLCLLKNGVQIGCWCLSGQYYRPLERSGFGSKCEPPFPVPEWAVDEDESVWWDQVAATPPVMNFGVSAPQRERDTGSARRERGTHLEINGQPASRSEVVAAIEKGVPTDSSKFRLTVIGADAERARVLKDWETAPASLREKTLVWSVPADHWSLRDNATGAPMFALHGTPTVYFTDGKGKVLYHEDDYQGPGDIEAIRRASADYEAKRDPGRAGGVWDVRLPAAGIIGGGLTLLAVAGAYGRKRHAGVV